MRGLSLFLCPRRGQRRRRGGKPFQAINRGKPSAERTSKRSLHKCALLDFAFCLWCFGHTPHRRPFWCRGALPAPKHSAKKKTGQSPDFFLYGRRAKRVFLCQKKLGQRAGVFRPSGEDLCVIRFKRNHFCDSVFSGFKAITKSTSKAKCRADHVGV